MLEVSRGMCTVPLVCDSLWGSRSLWHAVHCADLATVAGWCPSSSGSSLAVQFWGLDRVPGGSSLLWQGGPVTQGLACQVSPCCTSSMVLGPRQGTRLVALGCNSSENLGSKWGWGAGFPWLALTVWGQGTPARRHGLGGLYGECSLHTSGSLQCATAPLIARAQWWSHTDCSWQVAPCTGLGWCVGRSGCWCGCTPGLLCSHLCLLNIFHLQILETPF